MSYNTPPRSVATLDNVNMSLVPTPTEDRRMSINVGYSPDYSSHNTQQPPHHRGLSIGSEGNKHHTTKSTVVQQQTVTPLHTTSVPGENPYELQGRDYENHGGGHRYDDKYQHSEEQPHQSEDQQNIEGLMEDPSTVKDINPYSPLVEESSKWIRELEKARDDMNMMTVKNAILLDRLTMTGADVEG